jgi:hypothetical protein
LWNTGTKRSSKGLVRCPLDHDFVLWDPVCLQNDASVKYIKIAKSAFSKYKKAVGSTASENPSISHIRALDNLSFPSWFSC